MNNIWYYIYTCILMNCFTVRYYIVLCGIYAQVTIMISILQMMRNTDINFFPDHAELLLQSNGIITTYLEFLPFDCIIRSQHLIQQYKQYND